MGCTKLMGQNIISDAACSTTAERLWWLTLPKCLCVHVASCHVITNVYQYFFQLQNCVTVQSEKVKLCKMKDICITHTWRQQLTLKSWYPCAKLHDMTSQKAVTLSLPFHIAVFVVSPKHFSLKDWGITVSVVSTGIVFTLNLTATYQKIWGFGGAFTDSAGINIDSLSMQTKKNLMR